MRDNIYDSWDLSKSMKKNLKKMKKKYSTYSILSTLEDMISSSYEDIGIETELSSKKLIIHSDKKKNNYMKEIKDFVYESLLSLVDEEDLDLMFDINANKNNICIRCKRNIEH